jgi:hypothetical protein
MRNQDGIKLYSVQTQINDKDSENGIVGQRQESIAIVPTKPGTYTLPEVSAYWFDTKSKTLKKASLAPVTFTVAPAAINAAEPQKPDTLTTLEPTITQNAEANPLISFGSDNILIWQIATLTSTVLWLLTLVYILLKKAPQVSTEQSINIEPPAEAKLFKQLQAACKNEDAPAVINHCLQWAAIYSTNSSVNHIKAIADQVDKNLAAQLNELEASIYGAKAANPKVYKDIARTPTQLRKSTAGLQSEDTIAPLYK